MQDKDGHIITAVMCTLRICMGSVDRSSKTWGWGYSSRFQGWWGGAIAAGFRVAIAAGFRVGRPGGAIAAGFRVGGWGYSSRFQGWWVGL